MNKKNRLRIPTYVADVNLPKELAQALSVVINNSNPRYDTYGSRLHDYKNAKNGPSIDYVDLCLSQFKPRNEKGARIWEKATEQLHTDGVIISPEMLENLKKPAMFNFVGQIRSVLAKKI